MIPRHRPEQSFADHQAEVANWLGCSVEAMNADHDLTHLTLCHWLSVTSHAMREAEGANLTPEEAELAAIEEEAVLHVQRFAVRSGASVP